MRVALIVEYQGTRYSGFQYQSSLPTIQGELEKALSRFTHESIRLKGAGRTDTGVHAKGQVVAFDTNSNLDPNDFVRALNHYLPNDIAVQTGFRVDPDFDPRRMALSRVYRYTLEWTLVRSPLSWTQAYQMSHRLNIVYMKEAIKVFVGKHDFSQFSGSLKNKDSSTIREIYNAELIREGSKIYIEFEGNAFLPRQVRRMVGAIIDVGLGRTKLSEIEKMLKGQMKIKAVRTVPPQGLCLMEVKYQNSW